MSGRSSKNRYAATKERLGMVAPVQPEPMTTVDAMVSTNGTLLPLPVQSGGTDVPAVVVQNNRPRHGFQPGKSGNPGGRPKTPEEIQVTIRNLTPEMLDIIASLAREAESPAVRLEAARYLTDRRLGKPVEVTKMDVTEGQPGYRIQVEPLAPEPDHPSPLSPGVSQNH